MIDGRTVTEVLDHVLLDDPARLALVGPSASLSYEGLDQAADAAAAAFSGLGVCPGDRIAVCLPNDIDIVVAFHGAMRLGAIWVGVNRALSHSEKQMILRASSPRLFVADPQTASEHTADLAVVAADPNDPEEGWIGAVTAAMGARRLPPPDWDRPAGIAFTSGTTGIPKGIVHSQRNLLLPAAALVRSRRYDHTLRKGDCLPLTIINLQTMTTLVSSLAGGSCVLTESRYAASIAEWIGCQSVTVWGAVPALLYSMVYDPDIEPSMLSSLREVWAGGAPCPQHLSEAFTGRFKVPVYRCYGLTEAPAVVSMQPIDRVRVSESSGIALPHVSVRVRLDDGSSAPAGTEGELAVGGADDGPYAKAYTPMLGYWQDNRLDPFRGAEFLTGDIGVVDEAGNVFVRDRKKVLIIRGGANISPGEVERVLEQAPGVRVAAVLGVPDPRLGQRVVAALEIDPRSWKGTEATINFCRTYLAGYKVPEELAIVDHLPLNAIGKVQIASLVALFSASEQSGQESS